jgi:hypothetical protein
MKRRYIIDKESIKLNCDKAKKLSTTFVILIAIMVLKPCSMPAQLEDQATECSVSDSKQLDNQTTENSLKNNVQFDLKPGDTQAHSDNPIDTWANDLIAKNKAKYEEENKRYEEFMKESYEYKYNKLIDEGVPSDQAASTAYYGNGN